MIKGLAIGLASGAAAVLALSLARPAAPPYGVPAGPLHFDQDSLAVVRPSEWAAPSLDRRIDHFQFDRAPLAQVLEEFRRRADVNLVVDWDGLGETGVDRQTPVTVDLRDLPAAAVLRFTLDAATRVQRRAARRPERRESIGFGLRYNAVVIGSDERGLYSPSSHGYLRVYDIRDLMLESASFTSAFLRSLPAATPTTSATEPAEPSSASNLLFEEGDPEKPPTTELQAFDQLANVIRTSIDPQSWVRTEGEGGDIEYWAGRAIVTQTRENHAMVESFFRDLRAELKARREGEAPAEPKRGREHGSTE